MPAKTYPVPGLEADPTRVREGTSLLYHEYEKIATEHQFNLIETFMIAHSFHKLVVVNIMARWRMEGVSPSTTYHLADMTWRKAMQQLVKLVIPKHPDKASGNAGQ